MGGRRSFQAIRAEQRERDAALLERYSARLRQRGAWADDDFSQRMAIVIDALASSMRAGIGPETGWPETKTDNGEDRDVDAQL